MQDWALVLSSDYLGHVLARRKSSSLPPQLNASQLLSVLVAHQRGAHMRLDDGRCFVLPVLHVPYCMTEGGSG